MTTGRPGKANTGRLSIFLLPLPARSNLRQGHLTLKHGSTCGKRNDRTTALMTWAHHIPTSQQSGLYVCASGHSWVSVRRCGKKCRKCGGRPFRVE